MVEDAALMRSVLLGGVFEPLPHGLPALRIGLCRRRRGGPLPMRPHATASKRSRFDSHVPRAAALPRLRCLRRARGLIEAQKTLMAYQAATSFAYEYDRHRERLSEPLRELIEAGMRTSHGDALRCIAAAGQARFVLRRCSNTTTCCYAGRARRSAARTPGDR